MKVLKLALVIIIISLIVWALYTPTPSLHQAVKSKSIDKVKELIDKGTNINAVSSRGITALHLAAEFGTFEIVKLLLEQGADVNALTMYNVTPLHFAAQGGDINIANLLIHNGAILNAKDNEGRTPLLWIIGKEYASKDMIDLLELHEDANEIWARVKCKEDYKRVVLLMRKIDNDEFNNMHMIKRTPQEIQEYLDLLLNLR